MRAPWWTVLFCGIATAVYFVPMLSAAAIYDREAIAGGEWWRLVTGNLVHFSPMHLTFDVVALLVAGSIIELRRQRHWWLVCCTAGAVIGITVYLAAPDLRYYGGLSGIVTAAVVYLCLEGLRDTGAWRDLCMSILVLVAIKIGIELMSGQTLFLTAGRQPFEAVPVSHLAGACTALLLFASMRGRHASGDVRVGAR